MSLVLDVDGRRNEVDAPAETTLLYALRNDLRAYGPKLGKTICWLVSRPRQDDRCRSTGGGFRLKGQRISLFLATLAW